MFHTYKATLKGTQIEWQGDAPDIGIEEQAVEVFITILQEGKAVSLPASQGQRMAEILEQLAALPANSDLADPITWQQQQREDRSLPERTK